MFTHVMNLAMNAAIFRTGPDAGGEVRVRQARRRPRRVVPAAAVPAAAPAVTQAPSTYQIYAAAFNTAVHGR